MNHLRQNSIMIDGFIRKVSTRSLVRMTYSIFISRSKTQFKRNDSSSTHSGWTFQLSGDNTPPISIRFIILAVLSVIHYYNCQSWSFIDYHYLKWPHCNVPSAKSDLDLHCYPLHCYPGANKMTAFALSLFSEHFCNSKSRDLGIFNTYIEWVIHTFSSWSILKDFTRPLRPDNSIKIHDVSPVENTKEIVLLLLLL